MDEGVSVGQALLISAVPATLALLGVMATVIVGQRQAKRAWVEQRALAQADREHEQQIERDRLLRVERIALYRGLIAAVDEVLLGSVLISTPLGDKQGPRWDAADKRWSALAAEAHLLAAPPVLAIVVEIDELCQARERDRIDRGWADLEEAYRRHTAGEPPTEPETDYGGAMEWTAPKYRENDELRRRLFEACRADVAAIPQ